jgi:hypothetical protein
LARAIGVLTMLLESAWTSKSAVRTARSAPLEPGSNTGSARVTPVCREAKNA